MSRDEALVAVYVAARALKTSTQLPVPEEPAGVVVAAPLLRAVYSAVDAVDAVGEIEPEVAYPATYARRVDGLCTVADCWRRGDTAGGTCFAHSPMAHAPQVRRRDSVFDGAGDE